MAMRLPTWEGGATFCKWPYCNQTRVYKYCIDACIHRHFLDLFHCGRRRTLSLALWHERCQRCDQRVSLRDVAF
eukprot:908295-Pyramimonas_sp.AAC.1